MWTHWLSKQSRLSWSLSSSFSCAKEHCCFSFNRHWSHQRLSPRGGTRRRDTAPRASWECGKLYRSIGRNCWSTLQHLCNLCKCSSTTVISKNWNITGKTVQVPPECRLCWTCSFTMLGKGLQSGLLERMSSYVSRVLWHLPSLPSDNLTQERVNLNQ